MKYVVTTDMADFEAARVAEFATERAALKHADLERDDPRVTRITVDKIERKRLRVLKPRKAAQPA